MCWHTLQYKILEGENLGKFGKLQEIRQNVLVQKFSSESRSSYLVYS